jgi:putative oxidoreductase
MIDGSDDRSRRGWALLPLRLIVGYGFVAHGLAKWSRGPEGFGALLHQLGVPAPVPMAWLVTLLEVFGGLAILAGVFVALVSIPLIVSLVVAMMTVHLRFGFSSINTIGLTASGPVFGPPGYEIDLLYIASLIALALLGPGPLSVGRFLRERFRTLRWKRSQASPCASVHE